METYVIIRQVKANDNIPAYKTKPVVKFSGNKEKGEALMFRIIMNSENGFTRVQNEFGIEVEIKETITVTNGNKSVPINADVTYYFYPVRENN